MEVRGVRYCESLVSEMEGWSAEEFAWARRHAKFDKFLDEYLTAKCTVDFWWFLVYGVYHRGMKHYDPVMHRQAAYWLQDWTMAGRGGARVPVQVKWLIWLRESCKTQMLIAYDAWQFVRDRNARGMVRAYTDPKAQQITAGVMELLMAPSFQRRWGYVRPATKGRSAVPVKWRPEEFLLERDEQGVRVSSMIAMGMEGEGTGDHYHFGHYDDIETRTNANSDTLRPQIFDVWRNDNNLFEAGSRRFSAGTPWSRLGLVHGVLHRTNGMEGHNYDVLKFPAVYRALERARTAGEPVLLPDRRTLRAPGIGECDTDLTTCQARVRFWSEAALDTLDEIREVVWCDHDHIRVNRPFPQLLGQPIHLEVGPDKPMCPVRQTLDEVDYIAGSDVELPPRVASHIHFPGVNELNNRSSLPQRRKDQGATVYTAQMMLEAVSAADRILNPDDLKIVRWADVPAGDRRFYRSIDCARGDDKRRNPAATAMTTGFYHATGLYITHICFHETMGSNAKLLELILGVLRVRDLGGRLRETTYETSSAIEATLKDFLPQVERDPYKYFHELADGGNDRDRRPFDGGPTYKEIAGRHFVSGERVLVSRRGLPRKLAKLDRIDNSATEWESGRVHVVDTCPHIDELLEQAKSCTWGASGSFDLLDTVADLILEYGPKRRMQATAAVSTGESDYDKKQRMAMERAAMTGVGGVTPGWR